MQSVSHQQPRFQIPTIGGFGILINRRSVSGLFFAGHVSKGYLPLQSTTPEHSVGATEDDIDALVDKVGEIVIVCWEEAEEKNKTDESRKSPRRSSHTLLITILF